MIGLRYDIYREHFFYVKDVIKSIPMHTEIIQHLHNVKVLRIQQGAPFHLITHANVQQLLTYLSICTLDKIIFEWDFEGSFFSTFDIPMNINSVEFENYDTDLSILPFKGRVLKVNGFDKPISFVCTHLHEIHFGDCFNQYLYHTVRGVNHSVFEGCSQLKYIDLGFCFNKPFVYENERKHSVFEDCSQLETLDIGYYSNAPFIYTNGEQLNVFEPCRKLTRLIKDGKEIHIP